MTTLLELTQDILSEMEDDEVNSIGDTVSATSVAQVIKNVYDETVAQLSVPGNDSLFVLESLSDVNHPSYMRMPDNLKKIHWIKYNKTNVTYLIPSEFIDYLDKRDEGDDITDFSGVMFKIKTDSDPTYWTSFDDEYLVFDSYNSEDGSTLLSTKTLAWVETLPTLSLSDDSIIDLPPNLIPTLLSSAKARCFVAFKQVANVSQETASRKGLIRWQNDQFRHGHRKPYNRLPNYGKPRR